MGVFNQLPSVSTGFKLKRLSEQYRSAINQYLKSKGIEAELYTCTVLLFIQNHTNTTVSGLAKGLEVSQPAATQFVRQLSKKNWIKITASRQDSRVKWIKLSPTGNALADLIQTELNALEKIISVIAESEGIDLLSIQKDLNKLIAHEGLNDYLRGKAVNTPKIEVSIIPFSSEFKKDFKKINKEWIEKHLGMSQTDRKILNNPEKELINKKGAIYLATEEDAVIGTVALQKVEKGVLEMSKLAVRKKSRKLGIGKALIEKCIEEARSKKAKKLVLYTNSKMVKALNLYYQKGFTMAANDCADPKRCNVKMELTLD